MVKLPRGIKDVRAIPHCLKCSANLAPAGYCHRQDHGAGMDSLWCCCCGDFFGPVPKDMVRAADTFERVFGISEDIGYGEARKIWDEYFYAIYARDEWRDNPTLGKRKKVRIRQQLMEPLLTVNLRKLRW